MNKLDSMCFIRNIIKKYFNSEILQKDLVYDNKMCEKINAEFIELYSIEENKDKYNLNWAFENFNKSYENFEKRISYIYNNHTYNDKIEEFFKSKNDLKTKMIKNMKKYEFITILLKYLVDFIEIFFSILLIVVLSNISHSVSKLVKTFLLSFAIAIIFALIKIFLEKKLIGPIIEKIAWNKYKKVLDRTYYLLISIVTFKMVTDALLKEGKSVNEITRILKEESSIIDFKYTDFTKNEF